MVICLERDADLYMAQLIPLPLTVSCFSKIQIGFTILVLAHLGSPGKRAVKRECVCVLWYNTISHCCMHCLSAVCSQRSVVCFRLDLLTTWSTRCGRRGLNLSSPTVKTFSTRSRTIATGTATRCRRAGRTVGVAAAAVVAAMSAATTTKNLWTASLRPFHSDVGWF